MAYVVDLNAPTDHADCPIVETTGDPFLAEDPATKFHGVSQQHLVFYLDGPAAAGSHVARFLGSPQGVAMGYHLVLRRERGEAEVQEAKACKQQAATLGLRDFQIDHPDESCELVESPFFDPTAWCGEIDSPSYEEINRGLHAHIDETEAELGCPVDTHTEFAIVETAGAALTIPIGPELRPLGFNLFSRFVE